MENLGFTLYEKQPNKSENSHSKLMFCIQTGHFFLHLAGNLHTDAVCDKYEIYSQADSIYDVPLLGASWLQPGRII